MSVAASAYLQAMFNDAIRLHQSGQLIEAERLYQRILATDRQHADSLHFLGVIATQRGNHDLAVSLIGQAIAIRPEVAPYHTNLGASLRHLGRLPEAVESYRAALRIKDDYAEAHNHLGAALNDLGDKLQAETSFRRAIDVRSDFADAHNNLGNLLRETGRATESERHYRQALQVTPERHPRLALYLRNFAIMLKEQGRLDDAEDCLRRALLIAPQDPELHNNLGLLLKERQMWDEVDLCHRRELLLAPDRADGYAHRAVTERAQSRLGMAQSLCRRALQLQPDLAEAHHCLGTILLDLGQIDAARLSLETALLLAPRNAVYHFNLGATKRYRGDDPQLILLQDMLTEIDRLPNDEQVHLHFALAKAYDEIGEKDRGFAHLLSGNRLKRKMVDYDEAAALGLLQRIKAVFDQRFMRDHFTFERPATGPIFIVGMPRSGSTLVEQILASHPSVYGGGELNFFQRALSPLLAAGDFPEAIRQFAQTDLNRLGAAYQAALSAEAPDAPRITDKLLRNFLYCGLIHLALPNARIIHTRRDPVDSCLSSFSKLFVGAQAFTYDLAELGRYYRAYEGLMDHWRAVLPTYFLLDVQYEAMVADMEGQTRRILAHCGLPWDDACLSFHQTDRTVRTASATQVRQPIYQTSVGRWRPDADALQPLLDALG